MPSTPVEQQAFRSRSFRRLIVVACSLFLFIATINSVNLQNELRQRLADDYLDFRSKNSIVWLPRAHHVEKIQVSMLSSEKKQSNVSPSVEQHIDRLPEVIRIPFEEAVGDVTLQGWEDEWISSATFDHDKHGSLSEPKIDFVYNWVNGSEEGFKNVKRKYELKSPLNDADGKWMSEHSINRYRDWDELKYSFRSIDRYAKSFTNKIQLLVNSVQNDTDPQSEVLRPQRPNWLKNDEATRDHVEILAQEDFFANSEKDCLPSFDSLSIETQIHNTPSDVDQLVALSDDMFLGAPHSAADFFSPLFGSMMAFKQDHYNIKDMNKAEVPTFGEKPYLYYTSWLLNHRFGERERKVQAHISHAVSRRVMKEAMATFPGPASRGTCERFRGESKYQIYPWYAAFHYSIERFREALLWSFIMTRGDVNGDGYLDWDERQAILEAIRPGRRSFAHGDSSTPVRRVEGRQRIFYQVPAMQEQAGLTPPLSNIRVLWTSLDGPETIQNVKCHNFHIDRCLAESFDSPISDALYLNPDFSAANIFSQLSRRDTKCGDCLIKFMLSTTPRGLEPMLPPKSMEREREIVIKALVKYQHTVVEPDAKFVMVKDAEQAQQELIERTIKKNQYVSQWCFNDDVMTDDQHAVSLVNNVVQNVFNSLFPAKSRWEI